MLILFYSKNGPYRQCDLQQTNAFLKILFTHPRLAPKEGPLDWWRPSWPWPSGRGTPTAFTSTSRPRKRRKRPSIGSSGATNICFATPTSSLSGRALYLNCSSNYSRTDTMFIQYCDTVRQWQKFHNSVSHIGKWSHSGKFNFCINK